VWGDSINYTFHISGEVEDGTGGNGGGGDDTDKPVIDVPEGYVLKFFEDFENTPYEFTPVTCDFPWHFEYQCGEVTSYDDDGVAHDAESWLVSSPVEFTKYGSAKLSFDYVIRYCAADKVKEYNSLLISRNYAGNVSEATWEVIDFGAVQNTSNWDKSPTGYIDIPASYMGDKCVVLAFRYIGTADQAGTFEVDNVKLVAAEGSNDGDTKPGSGEEDGDDSGDNNEGTGSEGNGGNFTGGAFTLVTDAAQLTAGDSIVIVYENFVMGKQTKNYREKTDIMTSGGKVTYMADDAQVVLLEEGAVDGTFAFNVGDGYLAASSSSSNYVVTASALDENGSWKITIGSDALATIQAQGDKTRNTLQYNTSAPRFSCYKSGQKPVNIYAKSPVATGVEEVKSENGEVETIYDLAGRKVKETSVPGIYIVGGKKVLVK
jgi:hypothetical protein